MKKKKLTKQIKMNDLKPFIHGEEGTHYACNIALEEGNVCCGCNNHDCPEAGAEGYLTLGKRLEFENILIRDTKKVLLGEIEDIINKWKNEGENPTETDLVLENILKEIKKL